MAHPLQATTTFGERSQRSRDSADPVLIGRRLARRDRESVPPATKETMPSGERGTTALAATTRSPFGASARPCGGPRAKVRAAVGEKPSRAAACALAAVPLPRTDSSVPSGLTARTRTLPESATYSVPFSETATPESSSRRSCACRAWPPSPPKPRLPSPATTRKLAGPSSASTSSRSGSTTKSVPVRPTARACGARRLTASPAGGEQRGARAAPVPRGRAHSVRRRCRRRPGAPDRSSRCSARPRWRGRRAVRRAPRTRPPPASAAGRTAGTPSGGGRRRESCEQPARRPLRRAGTALGRVDELRQRRDGALEQGRQVVAEEHRGGHAPAREQR
jgi:hypothetical protein